MVRWALGAVWSSALTDTSLGHTFRQASQHSMLDAPACHANATCLHGRHDTFGTVEQGRKALAHDLRHLTDGANNKESRPVKKR